MTYDPRAVVQAAYDPAWPDSFERERAWLLDAWHDAVAEVHHVGSTSVPGLAAKPVIDILVLLRRFPLPEEAIAAAVARGYEYRGEQGIAGRQYFSIRATLGHHIHAFPVDHPQALAMLRFRDRLRSDPGLAASYEALKRDLAARFPDDRSAYTDAKAAFVTRITFS